MVPASGCIGDADLLFLTAQHKFFEIFDRQWSAEEIPLVGVTTGTGKEVLLLCCFDTLGDDTHPEAPGKSDDGSGNGGIVGIGQHIPDKRLINLQLVQRQTLQIRQR